MSSYHTLLIDSHILIWAAYEPHRLKKQTSSVIINAENLLISQASLIELAFKYASGKLRYTPDHLYKAVEALDADILPVELLHLAEMPNIFLPHKDPFDRLLLAQTVSEDLTLLTADTNLLVSNYPTLDARL